MRVNSRYLAWLPCAALAAGLPSVAAADDARTLNETPPQVVAQFAAMPASEDRPTHSVETTHAETDPDFVAQDTIAEEDAAQQDTLADPQAHRDPLVATETHPERDARTTDDHRTQTADEARLEARVETTLALNRSLQRSDIKVKVDGDTARLEGTVDDDLHRELAEELAMNVQGIERVDNELEVDEAYAGPERDAEERTFAQTVEDATTTTAVKSRLLWSRHADGINTEVETRLGHVTLNGTAESEEARQMAEQLARNAWGVTAVTNNIVVDPEHGDRDTVAAADVRTDRERDPAVTAAERDRTVTATERQDRDRTVTTEGRDRDRTAATADDDNGFADTMSDAWITTKVRSSFLTSRWIASRDIDIETNDGVVVLSGELDNAAERDLAIEVAENIRGVERVDARNLTVIS